MHGLEFRLKKKRLLVLPWEERDWRNEEQELRKENGGEVEEEEKKLKRTGGIVEQTNNGFFWTLHVCWRNEERVFLLQRSPH